MIFKKIKPYYINNNFLSFIIIILSKTAYTLSMPLFSFLIETISKSKDNRIIFSSSPDYSDNGRLLSDYLSRNINRYEIIWLVDDPSRFNNINIQNVKFIKGRGKYHRKLILRALYYAYSANIVFYTHNFAYIKKRNNKPLLVNLWHGCGYKDTDKDNMRNIQEIFDYVLVPGEIFIKTKQDFFGCSQDKILDIGYPRYDLLKSRSNNAKKIVLPYLKERSADNLIIWMPTFRQTRYYVPENEIEYQFDLPIFTSINSMYEFDQYCKTNKILVVIKQHQNQKRYKAKNINFTNILFWNNDDLDKKNIQLYEILPLTDALITDYSSIGVDYLLLDKPIGFTLDDYEQYKNTRGFVFEDPREYMPGDHIYNLQDLHQFLKDVSKKIDRYSSEREKLKDIMHNETDHYCNRVAKYFNLTG